MTNPTILNSLENDVTAWVQAGNTGDTGGGSAKANGQFTITPKATTFHADGAYAYNNGYWYRVLPGDWSNATLFKYSFQFRFPSAADLAACQAVEFELQQSLGGKIHNMAWQADYAATKMWRPFDYSASKWVDTSIQANPPEAGAWFTVEAVYLRTGDTVTHVSLTLDGVTHLVNFTRQATAEPEADYVHAAFQLDSNSVPTPYSVEVQNMSVTMMPSV